MSNGMSNGNVNIWEGEGRLGRDPDIRMTKTGKEVCHFSVAVSRGVREDGAELGTDWIDCVAWEGATEGLQDCGKGDLIHISGSLRKSKDDYNTNKLREINPDLKDLWKMEVNVNTVKLLKAKSESSIGTSYTKKAIQKDVAANVAEEFDAMFGTEYTPLDTSSDDLPF